MLCVAGVMYLLNSCRCPEAEYMRPILESRRRRQNKYWNPRPLLFVETPYCDVRKEHLDRARALGYRV